jgi:hypothetical protein
LAHAGAQNGTLSSTKELAYDTTTTMNLVQEKLTEGTGATGQVKNQKDITYTLHHDHGKLVLHHYLTDGVHRRLTLKHAAAMRLRGSALPQETHANQRTGKMPPLRRKFT